MTEKRCKGCGKELSTEDSDFCCGSCEEEYRKEINYIQECNEFKSKYINLRIEHEKLKGQFDAVIEILQDFVNLVTKVRES